MNIKIGQTLHGMQKPSYPSWLIYRMLEDDFEGLMTTSKYAKPAKCSNDTALRDIHELKDRGIFIQNPGGGRSTNYRLPDREE